MDFGDCFESGAFWSPEDIERAVQDGKQHVASYDDITSGPRIEPLMPMDVEEDAFGFNNATAEDLADIQALVDEASAQRTQIQEDLPPIEQLLDGGHTPRPSGGPESFGAQLLGQAFREEAVTPEIGPRRLDF